MQPSSPTIQTRLRNLNNFKTRVNWVAAGGAALLALLALGSTDSPGTPKLLSSLVITLVVFAGVLLAYARTSFEWSISKIEHALESNPSIGRDQTVDRLPADARPWPTKAENAWKTALVLILLAMILFLLGTWWWLIETFAGAMDCEDSS
jgi:uncharacterized membrane protein YidH (DUF202 family)